MNPEQFSNLPNDVSTQLINLLADQEKQQEHLSTMFNSPSFNQGLNDARNTLGETMTKKRGRPPKTPSTTRKSHQRPGKSKVQCSRYAIPEPPRVQCTKDSRCTNINKHRGRCTIPKNIAIARPSAGDTIDTPVEL